MLLKKNSYIKIINAKICAKISSSKLKNKIDSREF
jgi:hypothetical protein